MIEQKIEVPQISYTVTARKDYIDIAKFIGLFLMILFHKQGILQTPLQVFGASFHMPVFFFTFGIVSSSLKPHTRWRDCLYKRFRTMMVPYLLWSAVYIGVWHIPIKKYLFIIWGSHTSITEAGGNSVLWFLPAMFIAAIIFDTLRMIILSLTVRKQLLITAFAAVACGVLSWMSFKFLVPHGYPFGLNVALSGLVFILIGSISKKAVTTAESKKLTVLLPVTALFAAATALFSWLNGIRVVMAVGVCGNYLLFVTAGVLGSVFVVLLSRCIELSLRFAVSALSYVGSHSMLYFASHYIVFNIIGDAEKLLSVPPSGSFLAQIIFVALTFAVCTVLCALESHFAPVFEGK